MQVLKLSSFYFPDPLRLMCVIQKRLCFNSLWAKPCPRTCPSLRIERSLILQYPAPVCYPEYQAFLGEKGRAKKGES